MLHHMVCACRLALSNKNDTVVDTQEYLEKKEKKKSFLTGDVGEGQRAGHRQEEEEDRQLHGGVLLVRLSAPTASCYYRLFSWGGLRHALRDGQGTEVPISSTQHRAENEPSKSRDPV